MDYKYNYILISPLQVDWSSIMDTYDSTIYKTKEWLNYLEKWKKITPFIVEISLANNKIGYFIGEKINKLLTIIGSPFEGIGTAQQGLSLLVLLPNSQRLLIYREIADWIFKNGHACFLQVEDLQLEMADVNKSTVIYEGVDGYTIDLTLNEDILFHNLHQKSCRYSINKAIKSGVVIRQTTNINTFIETYYMQLQDVFKKQGLIPTYDIDCVKSLISALYPDKILLLEAVSPHNEIIATGLFPGDQHLSVFWGGASLRDFQHYCPNELLIWEAIKMWKARGTTMFDLGGVRPYKLKFGPTLYTKPRLIFAKYSFLIVAKNICKKMYYGFRKIKTRMHRTII